MSDTETIRTRVKRRVRWCGAVFVLGIVGLIAMAAIFDRGDSPLFLVPFTLCMGAGLLLQYAIRCPRCSEKLGQEIGGRVGFSVWKKPPNFCPYCGVSFDEPCSTEGKPEAPVTSSASQNPIK